MANDYERHSEVSIDEEGFHDAAESLNELVKFQFEFSAPKICLQLDTQLRDGSEWQLVTDLSNMEVKLQQHEHDTKIFMKVESLMVKDNSNDERFPYIFHNVPVADRQELVSLYVR